MSKQLLLLVAFCSAICATSLTAQQAQPAPPQPGRIIGIIMGDTGPLVAAEVTVRKQADTTVVAIVATAKDGRFLVDRLAYGTYRLRVDFLGFKVLEVPKVTISAAEPVAELGTIKLQRTLIAHARTTAR